MLRRVLYIDLEKKESFVEDRYDLFEEWLGGTGVATQLLLEECPEGADPLSPQAPIIFGIGPLTALFPAMTKTVAAFKSPLNGELGESYAGGRLAMAMRFAGHEGIVIRGAAESPCYISIRNDEVKVKDATSIWGVPATVVGYILRDVETGVGRRSIIRIGPAGERLVRYAGVVVDTYRHFGRLGLGAVFGSKNLKAIVVSGTEDVEVPNSKRYRDIYNQLFKTAVKTDAMEKYHDIGTPINVNVLNQLKGLPTRNFQESSFEAAEEISGENLADNYLFRRVSCAHCPIGCIHIGMLKTSFSRHHEFEIRKISYDYELIYALGSNLGVTTPEGMLELIEACERQGLDAISTGVVLAWATEALDRGMITEEETLGVPLRWDGVDGYLEAIERIVKAPNDFYSALARGVEAASDRYGGKDFAMALGGNEVAGYHTGPAFIFGLAVGVRHSHLDNAGYSIDQAAAKKPLTPEEMVDAIIAEDDARGVYNSLIGCLFARGVYTPDRIVEALGSVGIERSVEDLEILGRKIFEEKYRFKLREGFDLSELRIPGRFYETVSTVGMIDPETIDTMMEIYRERRGWG